MPRKPKRPCSYPGCPRLVEGQYCDEHKKLTDKQYNQYGRDDFTKYFYKTPEWLYARKKQLEQHPFCEECLKEGKRKKATKTVHPKIYFTAYGETDGAVYGNEKEHCNHSTIGGGNRAAFVSCGETYR